MKGFFLCGILLSYEQNTRKLLIAKAFTCSSPLLCISGISFGIHGNQKIYTMPEDKSPQDKQKERYGDEAPTIKHVLIVFAVVAILIALSWLAWHKLHWFH